MQCRIEVYLLASLFASQLLFQLFTFEFTDKDAQVAHHAHFAEPALLQRSSPKMLVNTKLYISEDVVVIVIDKLVIKYSTFS